LVHSATLISPPRTIAKSSTATISATSMSVHGTRNGRRALGCGKDVPRLISAHKITTIPTIASRPATTPSIAQPAPNRRDRADCRAAVAVTPASSPTRS